MVATTSTQYFYIVENSTVLRNHQRQVDAASSSLPEGGGALVVAGVGMQMNSDGSPVITAESGLTGASGWRGAGVGGSGAGVGLSGATQQSSGGPPGVMGSGAVFYKHAHVATSVVS